MKNKLLFFEPPIKLKEEQLVRDSLNFRGKKKKKNPCDSLVHLPDNL